MKIEKLSKSYPGFSLNDINIEIPAGNITGLVGENGAGKTTLINLILNLTKRDMGNISIFGHDSIEDEKKIKSNVGFVIDSCHFHQSFTSNDVGSIVKLIYKGWDYNLFKKYLSTFEVEPTKKISDLSKGMKSKLLLSVALSHNPKLLILDEITSGLDPIARDDVLQILKEFANDGQRSILFSTHITDDLDKIADNIIFIHKGSIVFTENKEELLNKYLVLEHSIKNCDIEIKNEDVIKRHHNYDKAIYLIKNNNKNSKYLEYLRKPTIDDIMLLFVKGEGTLC